MNKKLIAVALLTGLISTSAPSEVVCQNYPNGSPNGMTICTEINGGYPNAPYPQPNTPPAFQPPGTFIPSPYYQPPFVQPSSASGG